MTSVNNNLCKNIFLVGDVDTHIVGNKLPTNKQVLKVLFYNTRVLKYNLSSSYLLVAKEVHVFWNKAGIPVQTLHACAKKIEKLLCEWRTVQRHHGRESDESKELEFQQRLDMLFDIAACGDRILEMSDDKKLFLANQRFPERIGFIDDIQTVHDNLPEDEVNAVLEKKKAKYQREQSTLNDFVEFTSSGSDLSAKSKMSDYVIANCSKHHEDDAGPSKPKKHRGTINLLTEKVVATLDVCEISSRDAVRVISVIAESCGIDVSSLVLNKTSIHNYRQQVRKALAEKLKTSFPDHQLLATVIHWDGKLFEEYGKNSRVERLVIVVVDGNTKRILSIPALENGTGSSQARAIADVLYNWGLFDFVKAICCDTTASNLGAKNGAAILLERTLGRDLLYFPCRHHIYEVVLSGVFDQLMPASTGPSILLFKRFQTAWETINKNEFQFGIDEDSISAVLQNHIEDIFNFISGVLQSEDLPRNDYREFLTLCLIFIGKIPRDKVKFYKPGAFSRARWMAKAIYCLKIFLFRSEFPLSNTELKSLTELCIFIVLVYVKAWYTSPFAAAAPNNDLNFIKKLDTYNSINPAVSKIALKKISNHLWYLNCENAAMAFFDRNISTEIKEKMVDRIREEKIENDDFERLPKRYTIDNLNFENILDKEIDFFIKPESMGFFEKLQIDCSFLDLPVSNWNSDENYRVGLQIVEKLQVVNDIAERGIKLITDLNNKLTHDEIQKQIIVQIVDEYHRNFPDAYKETLMKSFMT